jgi:hypothetical protein
VRVNEATTYCEMSAWRTPRPATARSSLVSAAQITPMCAGLAGTIARTFPKEASCRVGRLQGLHPALAQLAYLGSVL